MYSQEDTERHLGNLPVDLSFSALRKKKSDRVSGFDLCWVIVVTSHIVPNDFIVIIFVTGSSCRLLEYEMWDGRL